jgi:hypothetical protein
MMKNFYSLCFCFHFFFIIKIHLLILNFLIFLSSRKIYFFTFKFVVLNSVEVSTLSVWLLDTFDFSKHILWNNGDIFLRLIKYRLATSLSIVFRPKSKTCLISVLKKRDIPKLVDWDSRQGCRLRNSNIPYKSGPKSFKGTTLYSWSETFDLLSGDRSPC